MRRDGGLRLRLQPALRAVTVSPLHHRDAVDLDVERPGPFGNADIDARRRVFWEIARVDRVHGREVS
jgi:hypothetical protein